MSDFSADYIVRIYRFMENNPRRLVGVVEEVGVKGKKAFTNLDELWEIISSSKKSSLIKKERKPNLIKQKTNLRSKV